MAGHNYVNQVQDPAARSALLDVMGQVKALTNRVVALETNALQTTTTLDVKGQRIGNVGNPTSEQDVVTLNYLRAFVAAQGAF